MVKLDMFLNFPLDYSQFVLNFRSFVLIKRLKFAVDNNKT